MSRSVYQAARTMRDVSGATAKKNQLLRSLAEQTGKQKKSMTDEFNREMAVAEEKMQEELRKKMSKRKRRSGILGKIASLALGFIPGVGPILAGLLGAHTARKGIKDQQAHARGRIAAARKYGLDPRFAGTFLSEGAQKFGSQKKSMLDDLYAKTDVSSGDLLKATALGGLTGWGIGKMGAGFQSGFAAPSAEVATDSIATDTIASGTPGAIGDISAGVLPGKITGTAELIAQDPTFLQKLIGGFKGAKGGFGDFTKLAGKEGALSPENLTMLLMLLGDSADDIQ